MLPKLFFAAALAIGVLGRTVPEENQEADSWLETLLVTTELCDQDSIQQVKASMSTFKDCVTNVYVEDAMMVQEIRIASLIQDQRRLVKAFCSKTPQVKTCVPPLINGMSSCLTPSDSRTLRVDLDKMIDFVCENDGDKVALFLEEGGEECYEEKRTEIETCEKTTKSGITRLIGVYGKNIPDNEGCKISNQEDECVLAAVKSCPSPVPANLTEELMEILNSECRDSAQKPQSGEGQALTSLTQRDMGYLRKRILELTVRQHQIEIWNRENELKIQHTNLTSDIKRN